MNYATLLILLTIGLTGCQAIAGDDISVTLSSDMELIATESSMIQLEALAEQTLVIETLEASGTDIANAASINSVLASTVRANAIPTLVMREVIVDHDDMGSSVDTEMMEDNPVADSGDSSEMVVRNLGIAKGVRTSDGCTNGSVTQFTNDDERIYFTAEVFGLRNGTTFSLDWVFEERLVYRSVWVSDYSAGSECIWFFMTQDDAPFLPGLYSATLYMNENALPSQQFSINTG